MDHCSGGNTGANFWLKLVVILVLCIKKKSIFLSKFGAFWYKLQFFVEKLVNILVSCDKCHKISKKAISVQIFGQNWSKFWFCKSK